MTTKKWRLSVPEKMVQSPIIYEIGQKFSITTNVQRAEITAGAGGTIVLEVKGKLEEIIKAERFLSAKGIKITVVP